MKRAELTVRRCLFPPTVYDPVVVMVSAACALPRCSFHILSTRNHAPCQGKARAVVSPMILELVRCVDNKMTDLKEFKVQ